MNRLPPLFVAAALWLCAPQAHAQDTPENPDAEGAEALPLVQGPAIVEYIEAPYPEEAQEQGLEATVVMEITLDEDGAVQGIEVTGPAGHGFDEAAVDAVLEMTFSPALTAEGPVPVVFEFEYGFVLQPEIEEVEAAPPPINFEGDIREMGNRKPVEGVQVVIDGTDLVGTTDALGHFEVRGVPLGLQTVRLLHTGHVATESELEFVEGEATVARLWIRSETYRDNEVVAVYDRKEEEVTRRTLVIDEIKRIPGTFGDPVKVIQTLPGAARTPFGTGLLVIRGSNPEDSGVYIDGIRIPIIYHLTGTTSVLSPELIKSVDYLPGGYGVQYGRSMGGVVDIKTRTDFSEQGKLVWGTDILDSQLYFEGKVGKKKKQGLAIGARRSYIDAFLPLFTKGSGFILKPRYWDYQVKQVSELDNGRTFSTFVYGFDDILRVSTPDDFAQGSDQDTQGDFSTQYSSHRFIVQYHQPLGDKWALDLTPSVGVDGSYLGLGTAFSLDNSNILGVLRASVPYTANEHLEIEPGLDMWGAFWKFEFVSAIRITDLDDPLAEREGISFGGRGDIWSPDPFLKVKWRPLKDPDRWLIIPGIRYNTAAIRTVGDIAGDATGYAVSTSIDPRIINRFQISDKVVIKGATGYYHQPPQPNELIGVGTKANVGHERSWNSSVGLEQRISDAIRYDVAVFYKQMDDLILYNEQWTGFGTNPFFNGGDGRAYGMELILRHEHTGPFFGWISYTLSKAARKDTPYCSPSQANTKYEDLTGTGPCWYPFDFDQTHIFSAQGGYDLPHDFGISAQVQLVSGNPADQFNAGIYDVDGDFYNGFRVGDYNNGRLPPFFQTSLRFDRLWTFKRWQATTYVDLINAVRGVNPEFTQYNYDYSESAYVRGLPFIPNIGLEANFWL